MVTREGARDTEVQWTGWKVEGEEKGPELRYEASAPARGVTGTRFPLPSDTTPNLGKMYERRFSRHWTCLGGTVAPETHMTAPVCCLRKFQAVVLGTTCFGARASQLLSLCTTLSLSAQGAESPSRPGQADTTRVALAGNA